MTEEFQEPEVPERKKTGRPTILTETKMKAITDLLERGNTYTASAKAVGINPATLSQWVRRGKELSMLSRQLDETERSFVEFSQAVEKARATAEIRAVEKIRQAGDSSWQAAAWYLERANPQDWGLIRRTEITGANGGAIEIDVEAVNRKLEALIANTVIDVEAVDAPELATTGLDSLESHAGANSEQTHPGGE